MNQKWRKENEFLLTQSFEILFLNKNTNKISKKRKTINNKNNIDDKAFSLRKTSKKKRIES